MYSGLSTSSFRAKWTAGNWWEPAVQHRALGSVLCDDLGGGGERRKGDSRGADTYMTDATLFSRH